MLNKIDCNNPNREFMVLEKTLFPDYALLVIIFVTKCVIRFYLVVSINIGCFILVVF